ncbi:hypothetical protein Smp_142800 [Schistosoma mansoni]|nr:hypothetical protein Smp_142800 [Schistosoma mansoni]|eukprot:XP_018652501.1 hypothetical protein Smp_142800 [Schistosoma mansoni]
MNKTSTELKSHDLLISFSQKKNYGLNGYMNVDLKRKTDYQYH